jgi:predicted small integral membrane protein
MMIERILKIIMSGGLAILTVFIAYANVHDPGANLKFLEHVLSMDTVAPDSAMRDHALAIPLAWRVAFWLIVVGEGLTAALFAVGAVELWHARNSKARQFHEAKRFVYLGAAVGLLIWFVGFTAIAGEWYAMWQSQVWNGQQAAFRITALILLTVIFVGQQDCERY